MADKRRGSPRPERAVTTMPRFERNKRRLTPKQQLAVDAAVKEVMADPLLGEAKAGALQAIRVHKFKVGSLQLLLAYHFDERRNVSEAWAVGPHENFYRDLQDYLQARPEGKPRGVPRASHGAMRARDDRRSRFTFPESLAVKT